MVDRTNKYILSRRGFTLVEMAIVLVIVGILVGMGAGMITPLTNMTKTRETRESIAADRDSIISWAASNNRIPDNTLFPGIANIASDPWGQQFVYLYDPALSPPAPTKDTICGCRSTSLSVVTTSPAATIANVAFILLSSADDGLVQATLTASVVPVIPAMLNGVASGPTIANGTHGSATGVVKLDVNTSDIVSWVTLDELRSKIGCQGAQLKILNNELPYTNYSSTYGPINIVADGGINTGNYEWRVKMSPADPKPLGVKFNPPLPFVNMSTSNWVPGAGVTPLQISGFPRPTSPNLQGNFSYTIFVRDAQLNYAQKTLVMTINSK